MIQLLDGIPQAVIENFVNNCATYSFALQNSYKSKKKKGEIFINR